jgi:hypothetical protein
MVESLKNTSIENTSGTMMSFIGLQRATSYLIATSTNVKDLFSIPTCWQDVLDIRKWFTHLDVEDTQNTMKKHFDSHAVAATILLYLEELNGYLLTNVLHSAFVSSATISKQQARAYVFRLLLHRLPPSNYALLKNLMYLFSCVISIENKKKENSSQIINMLGPLLLKRSNDKNLYYRDLTFIQVSRVIASTLIKEWNFLFNCDHLSQNENCITKNHVNDNDLRWIGVAKHQNGTSFIFNNTRGSKVFYKNIWKGNYDQRCQPHFCIFQDRKNNINEVLV